MIIVIIRDLSLPLLSQSLLFFDSGAILAGKNGSAGDGRGSAPSPQCSGNASANRLLGRCAFMKVAALVCAPGAQRHFV